MVAVQRWKLKIKTVKSMVFYFKKVKKKTTNDDGKKQIFKTNRPNARCSGSNKKYKKC